jgi:hypothetical protein
VSSNPTKDIDVCMCVYYVFVLSCVQVAALRRTDPPSKECNRPCKKDNESEGEARAQQRAVDRLVNEFRSEPLMTLQRFVSLLVDLTTQFEFSIHFENII